MGLRMILGGFLLGSGLMAQTTPSPSAFTLSPRDFPPHTADAVGQAARDQITKPARPVSPDRMYSFDLKMGLPFLMAAEASLQLFRRWQFGFSYGVLPGGYSVIPRVQLKTQNYVLSDGFTFDINPNVATAIDTICPLVRYFPNTGMFYFQLTWALVRTKHIVTTNVTEHTTGTLLPDSTITAFVTLTHTLPTLSIGHYFWRRPFFVNISLGGTFILSSSSQISFSNTLPDPLGTMIADEAQSSMAQNFDTNINAAIAQIRQRLVLIPSIALSMGMMF